MAILRYKSGRFTPRLNDYTYSQVRQRRPRVAERLVHATREQQYPEPRSGSFQRERAD
jgi:hypothetical protein